jgi:hypothetical protein
MDALTSPEGSVALALCALLVVVGYRLARPDRGREWLAIAAYAAALVASLLGARGLLPGPTAAVAPAVRLAGAALLVLGLLLAGQPSRARRRAARRAPGEATRAPPLDLVYAGLAVVLAGQLARAPSLAGGIATAAGVLVCLAVAATGRAGPRAPPPAGAPRSTRR